MKNSYFNAFVKCTSNGDAEDNWTLYHDKIDAAQSWCDGMIDLITMFGDKVNE